MAAVKTSQPFDLTVQSTWSVKLGTSLARRERKSGYKTVLYNFHPRVTPTSSVRRDFAADSSGGTFDARLQVDDQEYAYRGATVTAPDHYVLILGDRHGEGARLERLDTEQVLNISKTPSEQDERVLRRKHPHVDAQESADEDDADGPRQDNPFDYRHVMEAEDNDPSQSRLASATSTPLVKPARSTPGPDARSHRTGTPDASARKKRKPAVESTASTTKRPNTAQRPASQPVPSVRLARKATLRPEDIVDDGELLVEEDTRPGASRANGHLKQSSMSIALSGQLSAGPISLHSAASSPASPLHGPGSQQTPRPEDDNNSIDLGSMSDGQDGGDEQEDGDIEDLELPSPVQDRRAGMLHPADNATVDEEDDDLSKELERAMAEQDDEPMKQPLEEESEEE